MRRRNSPCFELDLSRRVLRALSNIVVCVLSDLPNEILGYLKILNHFRDSKLAWRSDFNWIFDWRISWVRAVSHFRFILYKVWILILKINLDRLLTHKRQSSITSWLSLIWLLIVSVLDSWWAFFWTWERSNFGFVSLNDRVRSRDLCLRTVVWTSVQLKGFVRFRDNSNICGLSVLQSRGFPFYWSLFSRSSKDKVLLTFKRVKFICVLSTGYCRTCWKI